MLPRSFIPFIQIGIHLDEKSICWTKTAADLTATAFRCVLFSAACFFIRSLDLPAYANLFQNHLMIYLYQ